ncbi:MAG: HYR domain-containing protein [Saprospiraceae bacterium]|nr:HYR domain-containing protein [Saprospiraceae bacterium]
MRIVIGVTDGSGHAADATQLNCGTGLAGGETEDYELNTLVCPTLSIQTTKRINISCIGGTNGAFQFVGSGGATPYSYTLSTISGDITNTTGSFSDLVAKDYRLILTDANGCSTTSINRIESTTDFLNVNDANNKTNWLADSLISSGAGGTETYTYINAVTPATTTLKPNGDSLAVYNSGNTNALSQFISIGFPFKIDNFYYDSLVVSEDGLVSFNPNINPSSITSQWHENIFYRGLGNYSDMTVGDCQCDTAWLENPLPFIAPFRDDLQANDAGNVNSQILYRLDGTAPNRIFKVEWQHMRWHQVCNNQRNDAVSIQLELHETTNKVIFRYKPEPNYKADNCGGTPLGNFASVEAYNYSSGLFGRRLGVGNYLSVNPDSTALYSTSNVKTTNINYPAYYNYSSGKHFQFTPPPAVSCTDPLSILSISSTCSSGSDGTITLTATGGIAATGGNYYFSKDGGVTYTLATTNNGAYTFTGLAAGTYTIYVHDAQTYAVPDNQNPPIWSFVSQTVVIGTAVELTYESVDLECHGGTNGGISLYGDKGTQPYEFSIDNGATYSPSSTRYKFFSDLPAGTYNLKVRDANGCMASEIGEILEPDAITFTTSKTDETCEQTNGTATVSANGGTGSKTITCDICPTAAISGVFSGLAANTYIFTATDDNNCTKTTSITLSNVNSPPVSPNTIPSQTVCKNTSITLTPTGGTSYKFYDSDPIGGGVSPLSTGTSYTFSATASVTIWITNMVGSCESTPISTTISTDDTTPPRALCQNVTIQLNTSGTANLTAAQVNNGSYDNCQLQSIAVSKTSFDCTNLGTNTVLFTATDAYNNTATCSATITIEDKIPPSVSCKNVTIQLNASGTATLTTVQVDNASTDNCGITNRSLSKTSFSCSNLGTNTVIFTAFDASGNSATCAATITVEDKIAPTIVCPENMVVQLKSGECRRALTFSATATDNCSSSIIIQQLTGLQSGEIFGIGTFNTGFKATDALGNTSFCSFSITVKENTPTGSMTCLSHVNFTLNADCNTQFLPDYILNGENYGCFDNYSVQLQTLGGTILNGNTVTGNNVGSTLRAIVIENATGNRCSGTFTVFDFTPPIIQAPSDVAILCDLVNNAGTPQPSASGEPIIVKECSLPTSYYYSDLNFDLNCATFLTNPPLGFPSDLTFNYVLAQNAKRIIIRTFIVTDRAGNTSNTRQVLYIRSRLLGDVTLPPSNVSLSCSASRTEPTDTVVNGIVVKGTGFPSFNNKVLGNSFCGIYASYSDVRTQNSSNSILTIQRTWVIVNGCTNENKTWIQTITVADAPPTLTLLQNGVFQIPNGQPLGIQAGNLISNLADDCTTNSKMLYGLRIVGTGLGFPTTSSLTFSCDMLGSYSIEVWVKDEGGHIVTKTTTLTVRNDGGNCPTVSGMIIREDLLAVPTTIKLYNSTNDSLNAVTGTSYAFKELTAGRGYRIMPTRPNTDWINGVTMFDVALMSRQILGVEAFSSPYRYIAADVNKSGDIDAVDLLIMQRLILRVTSVFPNNNSWRFILKSFNFDDPTNPFSSDFPESLWIPNLTTAVPNGDFIAVKIGDINSSAGSVNIRGNLTAFELLTSDRILEKNKTYHIPIKISPYQQNYEGQMISALQFSVHVDGKMAQIERSSAGDLPDFKQNNMGFFKNEGVVTAAWYRLPQQTFTQSDSFVVLNLTVKATENTRLSHILSLNPAYTEGVAFDEKGNGAPVKLVFDNVISSTDKPILLANRPNPFKDETVISFNMPEESYAQLNIIDLMGKEVLSFGKIFSKGLNEVVFDAQTTPSVSSGIYIVRLQTGSGISERKIVLSR